MSNRAQKAMKLPSAYSSAPSVSAPIPPPPHHCALREKNLAKGLRCAVGYRCGIGKSAEGIKPPSASTLSHAGFPPLPQPLHAVALHGSAKDRYAIKRSPFAGCWCMGSPNEPRPLNAGARRCCHAVNEHNAGLCKVLCTAARLPVRIISRYV